MRSRRQHQVDVALARALAACSPWLVPEGQLLADAGRMVTPRATTTELADALRYHDQERRLTSVAGEVELSWKLNDAGRAWLIEHE